MVLRVHLLKGADVAIEQEADALNEVFERFLHGNQLIRDREVLRHDYIPSRLPHRGNHIGRLGMIVAPLLKAERCSNIFIYGKTGTGKTAVIKYVLGRLTQKAAEFGAPVRAAYVNCRLAGTEYRVFNSLCDSLDTHVPFTGLAVGEVFDRFKHNLEAQGLLLVVVLDELDELIKNRGDVLLYELTRINETLRRSRVSIIGISNDLRFKELLEPRVLSTLSEEEVLFSPYNASELQDILWERAGLAFSEGALLEGAVSLCAALAAAEHGDARRALDLLRVAGEVAEREDAQAVTENHVREAETRIEHDRVIDALANLTLHSKMVLYSVYLLGRVNIHSAITGDIYEVYCELCRELGSLSPLTQRRVSGLISELDTIGLLNSRIISRGRYGRTKKISLATSRSLIKEVYTNDDHLGPLSSFTPNCLKLRLGSTR
jgi:cell division control protein 6